MSKEVDRHQVFRTTRVRHTLKDDSCWILKSKQEKAEQDEERPNHDEENQVSPTRQKSYVLSTAKIFGSVDSSVGPLNKTEVTPSEGDSVNHSNGDVIPAQHDVSTVETAADTNVVNKTNEEQSNGGAEVPADVPEAECIQPVASAEENPEAAPPAEPAEPQLVITTAEEIEEDVETPAYPPAAANVADPAAGVPAEAGVVESNGTAEIHIDAAPVDEIQPEECSLIKAELANVVDVEDTGAEESTPPEGESCEENPSEQATIIAAPAEFAVDSSPETVVVTDTASEEQAPLPVSVESVPDIMESVSQSPPQAAVEITAGDEGPAEAPTETTESVESAAEAVVESTPETSAVTETKQEEVVIPDVAVQSVPDIISEPPAPPADGATAEDVSDKGPAEGTEVNVEAAAEVMIESSTETPVSETTLEDEATSHNAVQPIPDVVSEPAAPPAAEDSSNQHLAEPVMEEIIEATAEVVQESSPETPAVDETTPEEDASIRAVQPVSETVSEPSDPPAPETVTTSVEYEVQSAAQAEPLLEATTEEVVECEVQPVESNTTVEQTVEPTPEPETNRVVELDINDALETSASEVEAAQDEVPDAVVKLSDASDVATPVNETVPELAADPKPDHSAEPEPSPQCEETNTSEEVQKPAEEVKTAYILYTYRDGMCSFCNQKIGNVKIMLTDPLVQCHPECLKCGICALTLGDLLTPMFLRGQVIQCGGCTASALKI